MSILTMSGPGPKNTLVNSNGDCIELSNKTAFDKALSDNKLAMARNNFKTDLKKALVNPNESPEASPQRIVCAAMKINEIIIVSPRHFDDYSRGCITNLIKWGLIGEDWRNECISGFIDNKGNFLTREEALVVAKEQNQIIRRVGGDEHRLYSENLY